MTTVKIPAAEFQQGKHTAYVLSPTVGDLIRFMPERDNPDVIQDANRRLYIPHAKAIGDYLLTDENWVLGPLVIGIPEDVVDYQPRLHVASFDLDAMHDAAKVVDGQHRIWAIGYAVRRAEEEVANMRARLDTADDAAELRREIADREAWVTRLLDQVVVVIAYVEGDIAVLRQMFVNFAKVRVVGAETKALFDLSDPFNVAALELMESHELLKGRIDLERPTLTSTSNNIATLAQLASILRTLHLGINARPGPSSLSPRAVYARGKEFFDDIEAASDTARAVAAGTVEPSDLRARGNTALNPTLLRAEAAIWRQLRIIKEEEPRPVVDFLRTIPEEPSAEGLWVESGILPAKAEKATPMGRSQEMKAAVVKATEQYERMYSKEAA